MEANDELVGLEDELDKLKISIAVYEAAAEREFLRTGKKHPEASLKAMRNRLFMVERRIAKIKFGPLRLVSLDMAKSQ